MLSLCSSLISNVTYSLEQVKRKVKFCMFQIFSETKDIDDRTMYPQRHFSPRKKINHRILKIPTCQSKEDVPVGYKFIYYTCRRPVLHCY